MNTVLHKEIIKKFHEYKKPLLIYGYPGYGKTHVAIELLKNTILVRIDTISLREIKDIKQYIVERLKKRNITLMFATSNEQRGLLLDDIHIFYKYDKSAYKSIIEFIREGNYYGSKIILTCCTTFLKNKDLCKVKISRYEIKYTKSSYYKICLQILKDKHINVFTNKYDSLIYHSNYNLNTLFFQSQKLNLSYSLMKIL